MAESRIRGQEVTVRLTRGGALEASLTAIKDFTCTFDFQTLEEGYLGETNKRFDFIVNGCSGAFTIDAESPELFTFIAFLTDLGSRRVNPNQQNVNSTTRYQFSDGQVGRLRISRMAFDPASLAAPARDAYVNTSFSYKAAVPAFI